ncbi:MAG: hypothetical protein M1817_003917 [Caeruleum heppii]|nr:MAG: hypothetical protein M1817_003917 [Caeruleum heppii]
MDWTPTVDPFQPNSRFPEPDTNGVLSASSFSTYQRLPPAPKGPAAKLRNPTRTAPFFQASSENQQTMFGQLSSDSVATPLSRHHSRVSENLSPVMKAPRFFPVADYRADTGLEGLFDAAFSLRDEPVSIGSGIEKQVAGSTAPDNVDSLRRLLMAIALSCSLLTWKIVAWSQSSSLHLHIGTISISIIIATRAYFSVQNHQIMGLTDWSGTIIGGLQLACAIAMFAITVAGFGSYELIDLLGSVSLGGMIAQELWMLASGYPLADGKLAASLDTSSQQDSGSSLSFDSKPISQTQRDSSDRTIGGGDRSRTRSPAKQGRVTRSTSQRESYIPSTRLSGMSLGDSSMNKAFSGSPSLRSQKLFPSSATAAAKAQRGAHKY